MNEHQEFINNLKVGDKIAVRYKSHFGGGFGGYTVTPYYKYMEITKITPKRQRITCDESIFDSFNCFCPISDKTDKANETHDKIKNIDSIIYSLTEQGYRKSIRFQSLSFLEEDYDEVTEILGRLNKLIDKGINK